MVDIVGSGLLMKGNQNSHNLTDDQTLSPFSLLLAVGQEGLVPDGQKYLAEIIEIAEQLE